RARVVGGPPRLLAAGGGVGDPPLRVLARTGGGDEGAAGYDGGRAVPPAGGLTPQPLERALPGRHALGGGGVALGAQPLRPVARRRRGRHANQEQQRRADPVHGCLSDGPGGASATPPPGRLREEWSGAERPATTAGAAGS